MPDGRDRQNWARCTTARPDGRALEPKTAQLLVQARKTCTQYIVFGKSNMPIYGSSKATYLYVGAELSKDNNAIDEVRASRAGHTFHERWAARRALQLVFPQDDLHAIAVEGLSTSESAKPGKEAGDIADLTLFFGQGDSFATCEAQQTLQFKYKATPGTVTSSYLKQTIQKFAASLLGYEEQFSEEEVKSKLSFSFVTNAVFADQLWESIKCLKEGTQPAQGPAQVQYGNLVNWCKEKGVEAKRLFALTEFHASTESLTAQNLKLRRTLSSWSPGTDSQARARLHSLEELVREKAGVSGQRNNLIKREDILDALGCDSEDDLFPAETEFVDVGVVVEREALDEARTKIENETKPVFIFADGGVGKTVFIQSLANKVADDYETVIFDCFGGGSYRSEDQSRHLPKIGLLQIVNELASRGLCDLQLPTDGDSDALIKAARKRLKQTAETVSTQSSKKGLLVIIDAADNAQLEANTRQEKAFPRLLLASLSREPIDGVKLVLTARPHRMDSVIGTSEVERFELTTFTRDETQEFLKSRRGDLTQLEFSTALARSGGNARVLEYLVESWDENVSGTVPKKKITVEELIRQRCEKIDRDLYEAGWSDGDVKQFFTAISLLPPPIPLEEMSAALGWSGSKVNSAVSDLAPMLEVLKHGAIFRDEPTETFIRESYASESEAQQEIADRLRACQKSSVYAAEALPRFLVAISDSDRAYALSASQDFPASIQSEYGRRRLRLLRLQAAFSLAVRVKDYDRVLRLTMQLAQVAAANAKGDQFIRHSPGVAVFLGDQDVSRRLFQDRTGWRGERDVRLTVAFAFQGEMEDAAIHHHRAIGWINWHYRNRNDDNRFDRSGPSASDFAAIVFLNFIQGAPSLADSNIIKWSFPFALSVCQEAIALLEQYEYCTGENVLPSLVEFASSKNCKSLALQVSLLASTRSLHHQSLKRIARAASAVATAIGNSVLDEGNDYERLQQRALSDAALAALIHNSRQSARNIVQTIEARRPSGYDYGDRYGPFRSWAPILSVCVSAWAAGQQVRLHHLMPREVKATRALKSIADCSSLISYLAGLGKVDPKKRGKSKKEKGTTRQFDRRECDDIAKGSALVIALAAPLQEVVLARREIEERDFQKFLETWESRLRFDISWASETARDQLCRYVGFGFAQIFLRHGRSVSEEDVRKLIEIISRGRFTIQDKLKTLFVMARHSNLHIIAGQFAKTISDAIRQDESIEQRSEQFSRLTEALLPMGRVEAQQYFRQGLTQLDQMGGDDFDTIYSLLHYAAEQRGGWLDLALGHRLMNLCQTIFHYEPSKFGWTLFGHAAAQSIGMSAIYKLVRWADQDTANLSYGLPQLACFLARSGHLDARRAAFMLLLCKEVGWHEWKIGDGLRDIFDASSDNSSRQAVWRAALEKMKFEHPFGGSSYLWTSLLEALDRFPQVANASDIECLKKLVDRSRARTDEENQRHDTTNDKPQYASRKNKDSERRKSEESFEGIVKSCDVSSPHSIDEAIRAVRGDRRFMFNSGKRIIERLRENCPFDRQAEFISTLGELGELSFDDTVEVLKETVAAWETSSAYVSSNKKAFVQRLFELKGSELFELRYTGVSREISGLVEFCDDAEFVLNLVFDTVAREKLELSGDEWLQLATSLCQLASDKVNREALEDLLSGPAAQIGDEVGEGAFKDSFVPSDNQSTMIAEITWHLLGNEDAFVRWRVARCITGLADLGLNAELSALLDCYDRTQVAALTSEGLSASFLNAQQWLLMGLARACLHHGKALDYLKEPLERLVRREDIHAVNKIHIIRCLQHISGSQRPSPEISKLWEKVYTPAKGYEERGAWPKAVESKSGFHFDYEFNKHEVSGFARLFGICEAEAVDKIADEVQRRWPEARDMEFFSGHVRYRRSHADRHESYRESVQKHAMLGAATKLAKSKPVIRDSYDAVDARPWIEWLKEHDVSFEDGAWLSDRKDAVPEEAAQPLTVRIKNKDVLAQEGELFRKLGFPGESLGQPVPLYGVWRSRDGVFVRISSALTRRKGVIGRLKTFARKPDHEIWLPAFDPNGYVDRDVQSSEFEPLVWVPQRYPVGIDVGDEFATEYPVIRPRLGRGLTTSLGLVPDADDIDWLTQDGNLALKSQVWGQWRPDPDDNRAWFQDEGRVLWAQPDWLDGALSTLNRSLVFHIDLHKYKRRESFDDDSGLHGVYVALWTKEGTLRVWKARKASETVY